MALASRGSLLPWRSAEGGISQPFELVLVQLNTFCRVLFKSTPRTLRKLCQLSLS